MPYLSSTTYPHSFFIFYFIFSILLPHAPFSLSTSLCPPYPCTHTHTHTHIPFLPFFVPFPCFHVATHNHFPLSHTQKGQKEKEKKTLFVVHEKTTIGRRKKGVWKKVIGKHCWKNEKKRHLKVLLLEEEEEEKKRGKMQCY
jgi:hypothetical protein